MIIKIKKIKLFNNFMKIYFLKFINYLIKFNSFNIDKNRYS